MVPVLQVRPRSVLFRPSAKELRDLTARMPNCRATRYGSLNVQTRVVARSKSSTFIVTDDPGLHSGLTQQAARMSRTLAALEKTVALSGKLQQQSHLSSAAE